MSTWYQLMTEDRKRIRKVQPVTNPQAVVKNASQKAANIYKTYRAAVNEARENKLITDEGRLHLQGEARDQASTDLAELQREVESNARAAKAGLFIKRDDLRPKVSEQTRSRIEGYYTRLADSGVDLGRLIELADGDKTALRCLEDLAPVLALAQRPNDPDAADGFVDLVRNHALDAYGSDYRAAHGEIEAFDRQAYMAEVAVSQARDGIRGDSVPVIPDASGQIIYDGNAA